ncbi:MAG: phosphatase PAP2 family protein [Gammaproteobacteria bacterium]
MKSLTRGASGCFSHRFFMLALPFVLLLTLTLVIRLLDLDLHVEQRFFSPDKGWIYGERAPWNFLYRYGVWPTVVIAFGALIVYALSFRWDSLRGRRRAAWFLVLLSIGGPIVVVNLVFKEHWGRPRPGEVSQFGGEKPYLEVWEKGVSGQGRSFPCGHCSAAFFFFGFFFIAQRRSRRWAYVALVSTLLYGALMGVARMVQGGHFPSDVLWSAGLMYYFSMGLYCLLGLHRGESRPRASAKQVAKSLQPP